MTLIEVLCVIAVLGLLAAVTVPAVQSSRASAATISCKNNLRELGIAGQHHLQTHGAYPNPYFAYAGLLDYLEQPLVAERLKNPLTVLTVVTSRSLTLPIFICPSDARAVDERGLLPSYLFSSGTGWQRHALTTGETDGFLIVKPGTTDVRECRAADISDGLSQTACMSEVLITEQVRALPDPEPYFPTSAEQRLRLPAYTAASYREPAELHLFADACETAPVWMTNYQVMGTPSVAGLTLPAGYQHILTPNRPSCGNGDVTVEGQGYQSGLYGANRQQSARRRGESVAVRWGRSLRLQ